MPWAEIVKGYEYEKGRFVAMTDEDFEKARTAATRTFEIRAFVPEDDIDPLFFDHPYYLTPSGRGGAKAYALLRDAMKRTGRVGVGTIVLRQREHLASLEPVEDALVLTTMRFAHELRSPKDLDVPAGDAGYARRELDLGVQLVETLAAEWRPEDYRDTYYEVLMKAIEHRARRAA